MIWQAWVSILAIIVSTATAIAEINPRNGALHLTFKDGQSGGIGYDLALTRTFNSGNSWNGMFGAGWCLSTYEEHIFLVATGVIARERCATTSRVYYRITDWTDEESELQTNRLLAARDRLRPALPVEKSRTLRAELLASGNARAQLEQDLGLPPEVHWDRPYTADQRSYERMTFNGRFYVGEEVDGSTSLFDPMGRFVELRDKNGNSLHSRYEGQRLISVESSSKEGKRKLTFAYGHDGRLERVVFPDGRVATYAYRNGQLVRARGVDGQEDSFDYAEDRLVGVKSAGRNQTFSYDATNRISRIQRPDGCTETMAYTVEREDNRPVFSVTINTKGCSPGSASAGQFRYAFVDRFAPDAPLAWFVVRTENTLRETHFHERFGRAISTSVDSVVQSFFFDPNGQVIESATPSERQFISFEHSCKKISYIEKWIRVDSDLRKKQTAFRYDGACNLESAFDSDKRSVSMTYDDVGRISSLSSKGKWVDVNYDPVSSKPALIKVRGEGTLVVHYKPDFSIEKVESPEGPSTAMSVASMFNNLLDIIAPATDGVNPPCYRSLCEDMSLWPGGALKGESTTYTSDQLRKDPVKTPTPRPSRGR